jgi:hypothetical protein
MFLCTLVITTVFAIALIFNILSNAKAKQLEMGLILALALLFYIYSYAKVGLSNPGLASS